MDITSYLLGKQAGGSTPAVLEEKSVTVTTNGTSTIRPSEGYDGISQVNLTTNVPSQKFAFTDGGGITLSQNKSNNLQPSVDNIANNVNTSSITSYNAMFNGCTNVTSLNLSQFDSSNVTDIMYMFQDCSNLTSLNLTNFNTSNVTGMNGMFLRCRSLTELNLSSFTSTSNPGTATMFSGCTGLLKIDMRNFDFTRMGSSSNMFGSSSTTYVPANCEIIVSNNTQKQWLNTNFSRMTNVKTVAEYEG